MYHHERGSSPPSDTQSGKFPAQQTPLEHVARSAAGQAPPQREAAMTAPLIAPFIPPRAQPGLREQGRQATARRLPMAAALDVPAVPDDVVYGTGRIGLCFLRARLAVVCAHGETGITARLEPATIDGLIYASSMVMLDSARRAPAVIAFLVVKMHCQCLLPVRRACGRHRSLRVPGRRPGRSGGRRS